MGSINAKAVAEQVLENLGKGKKVSVSAIARKKGYSEATAKNPKLITGTKTYKDTMAPFIKSMIKERDAIIKQLPKVRGEASYGDLGRVLDKLVRNIQLLEGKDTGKESVTFTWE